MKRTGYKLSLMLAWIMILIHSGLSAQNQKTDQPNIILIMADDLGYECIGANGGQSYDTPKIDKLASTGMRFDHCYSQPLCTPSRVQIMTGRYNFRNYKMFGYLDPAEITFANLLKDAGYKTCIAGKWQLGNGIEGPNNAGFDEYCLWQIYRKIAGKLVLGSRYSDPTIYENGKLIEYVEGKYGPDIFTDYITNFIQENKDTNFFVYYPMVLTHDPFVPTPDTEEWNANRGKKDTVHFKDMVEYMDKLVGRIVDKLDELGLRENTLIMFTGDNGSPRQIKSKLNDEWIVGGKSYMTNAGTHVPFIANWQGTIPQNQVSDDLIDFSDFLPTLAEAGNAILPKKVTFDGRSFVPQLKGEEGDPREWVFSHYWHRGRDILRTREYVRNKQYKLYSDGSFYDLSQDPNEKTPLHSEELNNDLIKIKVEFQMVLDTIKN